MRVPLILTVAAALTLAVTGTRSQGGSQIGDATNVLPATAQLGGIVPIHSGTDEADAEYGIWGAAEPSYKVSFHGDMTFIPYLGMEYPHNQPWSWHTVSVAAGGTALLRDGEAPERFFTDTRYEYRFGVVTEAYDLRMDGLEQTFVLAARPASRGDLMVRGRITTLLEAQRARAAHQEIVFRDHAGTEIARYGEAFAMDATGRTLPIATTFDGDCIALTVPAAFLDEAVFPVTIDPLLTPSPIFSGTVAATSVDICRDDDGDDLMVAYVLAASGNDTDGYARIGPDGLINSQLVFSDVSSSWKTPSVRCATAGQPQVYCLVVYRVGNTLFQGHVRFQVRASGNTTFSSVVQNDIVTPSGAWHEWPDVGGTTRSPRGDRFLIVWQKSVNGAPDLSEIWAVPVDITGVNAIGGGTLGTLVQVPKYLSQSDAERPTVNQTANTVSGSNVTWVVCWQEFGSNDVDWDLVVRQVDELSNVSPSRLFLDGTKQKLGPQIAGQSGRYAVVYAAGSVAQMPGKVTGIDGYEVDLRRFDWPNGSGIITLKPTVSLRTFGLRSLTVGGLAHDHLTKSHWVYLFRNSIDNALYAGRVGYNGVIVDGPHIVDRSPNNTALGGITFDDDNFQFPMAWAKDGDIWSNQFVYRAATPPSTAGVGCSPASMVWSGGGANQQIGCEFSSLRLNGMPINALSAVSLGFGPLSLPLPSPPFAGGCVKNADVFATTNLAFGPSATFEMPLPEFLARFTVWFQGYHTNAAGDRFLSTQALVVQLVR